MSERSIQWDVFFIEKGDGTPIPVALEEASFCKIFRKRPIIDGKLVFERILKLLFSETVEGRRRYPTVGERYPFPKFRKCRAQDVRVFFHIDEINHVLIFGADRRSDLKIAKLRKSRKRRYL